jgi:PAS domain S-box-containing protein
MSTGGGQGDGAGQQAAGKPAALDGSAAVTPSPVIPHELILGALGEGVYGLDRDGRGTFVNDAAVRILGWTGRDILGAPLHDIHHHSHADGTPYPVEQCPIYAALQDGVIHEGDDEVFWHANGSPIPVQYTSTPVVESGEVVGAVVVFRDISERRRLEAQRERAFKEISTLKEQLEQERDYLRDELRSEMRYRGIVGSSDALRRALAQIEAVAATPVSVLIQGESGVGKEGIAIAIHDQSPRAHAPLVKVNCASIPPDLFESEFFGHVKGSFTGAHRDRVGRMELADGGTLFLDEIGEIPLAQQGKLLRALQENEFERVGDDRTVRVDVRVVAATNRDLAEEVRAGRFREDLFYRLSVFPIDVPPLRDRRSDIGILAQHFADLACAELRKERVRISRRQIALLEAHAWPGNVRELKNVIERAVILSKGKKLRLDAAPFSGAAPARSSSSADDGDFLTEQEFVQFEAENLRAALDAAQWKISGADGAAALLGIKPSTLAYRMKRLGLVRSSR